jgi:hypothetical protein
MNWGWRIVAGLWGGFWAFVFLAATVPASQAISNLSSWARLLGIAWLAHQFATNSNAWAIAAALAELAPPLFILVLVLFGLRTGLRPIDEVADYVVRLWRRNFV